MAPWVHGDAFNREKSRLPRSIVMHSPGNKWRLPGSMAMHSPGKIDNSLSPWRCINQGIMMTPWVCGEWRCIRHETMSTSWVHGDAFTREKDNSPWIPGDAFTWEKWRLPGSMAMHTLGSQMEVFNTLYTNACYEEAIINLKKSKYVFCMYFHLRIVLYIQILYFIIIFKKKSSKSLFTFFVVS